MNLQELTVLEESTCFKVTYSNDHEDWVAEFSKAWPEAQDWANNMAYVFNHRNLID